MEGIILGAIFIVTFYYAFKTIWKNVTTVSYSGLSGFFSSWLSQLVWAGFIAGVVTMIAAKILESIADFGRGIDFANLFEWGIVAVVICAIFFHKEDAFDKKTFRDNYNRNVIELNQKLSLDSDILSYITHGEPGNLVDLSDEREAHPLSLAEDFISNVNSKLVQFPKMSISHYVNNKGNYTSIKISLSHSTCDDHMGGVGIAYMEKLILEITFTAAIEAVAKGKGRAIENRLHLINEHGAFGFLKYSCDEDKTVAHNHTEDGIDYIVSRSSNGNVSLKMLKKTSENK